MFNKEKACEKFFGSSNLGDILIITPITLIYDSLFKTYENIIHTSGWWNHKMINLNSKSISILKIPQGYSILDVLECIDKKDKIIFLGFCGGNSKKTEIGSIICPTQAIFLDNGCFKVDLGEENNSSVLFVRNFSEQDHNIVDFVLKNNIDCVDMETYLLFKHCQKKNTKPLSILIVSDLIDSLPFYELSKEQEAKIMSDFMHVEDIIKDEIRKIC